MNSKQPSIRVLGQRSIPSSFLFNSSNRHQINSEESKESVPTKALSKGLQVSLSDFLDRKLHKSSVLPKSVQNSAELSQVFYWADSVEVLDICGPNDAKVKGTQVPFLSPVGCGDVSGSSKGQNGVKRQGGEEVNCGIDKLVFEQFKHIRKDKEDVKGSCGGSEVGSHNLGDVQESRKRRNPFEGVDEKLAARKHLVVLGDDPKPKPKFWEEKFISNKKPKPLYNHYANGGGWWDCNMEGVDSEEVGCSEVWEGMGSITLGGLEWH